MLGAVLVGFASGVGAACVGNIPPSTPSSDFTVNTDATVIHQKTGLIWMRCSLGQSWNGSTCTGSARNYTWQQALQAGKALNDAGGYAGRTDWRLPNIKELRSIVESQCYSPPMNTEVFPNTPASSFWSASASNPLGSAWYITSDGATFHLSDVIPYPVRLVRAGQ